MSSASFAELAARSHFSFLEGSASPRDLVEVAARLGIGSLGLCDRNGLYGAVGFIESARKAGIRPVVGVELDLVDAGRLRLLARGRRGYRQLCRTVSAAQLAGVKGQPRLRIAGLTDALTGEVGRREDEAAEETDVEVEPGGDEGGLAGEEAWGCVLSEGLPQAADAMLPRQGRRSPVRAIGRAGRSEAPPPRRRRPTIPPPSRPQALRPTAGPFPEGWPSLPSTRDRVEGPPAVVDPQDLDDCIALAGGPESAVVAALVAGDRRGAQRFAERLRECFGQDRAALLLTNHLHPADRWLAAEVAELAERAGLLLVASATPAHATRDDKPLLDILTAIRHRTTLERAAAHGLLLPNCEHRLLPEAVLRRRLPGFPGAFDHAARIATQCSLDLDFTEVRFPGFPVPAGETPFSVLYGLCQDQVRRRYRPLTPEVARRLQMELDVIQRTNLAEFFLIVHEIMVWAREHGVPGQGRGSAADSIVAYLLGITRVDPIAHNLLFERFLHVDHQGTPDIDIDFSTDHREQVIQHVYEKYGAERTGMVANVVTFQPRLAVREVGKAMGFPEPIIDRLATSIDGWREGGVEDALEAAGLQAHAASEALPWRQFLDILRAIEGTPRHLSIHVGGMLVTGEPLVDVVPVERATMEGRVVVQFNKDDVEDLGLIKMDLLGLRTLSAVAECLELIERTHGARPDLDALPLDDPRVYDMICAVDTIGLFQIESRAQQQALYQSQPREFNDLVVQVAIIRPGPIQGDAVHPYLRRRQGLEPVTYLHPSLEPILSETKGVILYQEQILRIVMELAGYSAGEADRFRRAMNRHRSRLEMQSLHDDFVRRCGEHGGLDQDVAEKLFRSVAGFAEFGFCKSHAAAFAPDRLRDRLAAPGVPHPLALRPAQRPADGLLPSLGAGRRRQAPWHPRPPRRRHPEPGPLHRGAYGYRRALAHRRGAHRRSGGTGDGPAVGAASRVQLRRPARPGRTGRLRGGRRVPAPPSRSRSSGGTPGSPDRRWSSWSAVGPSTGSIPGDPAGSCSGSWPRRRARSRPVADPRPASLRRQRPVRPVDAGTSPPCPRPPPRRPDRCWNCPPRPPSCRRWGSGTGSPLTTRSWG